MYALCSPPPRLCSAVLVGLLLGACGPGSDEPLPPDSTVPSADGGTDATTNRDATGDASTPLLPTAPTGIALIPARSAIGIEWDEVPRAHSYNLYFSTAPFDDQADATKLTDVVPAFVHRDLSSASTYYYAVTAVVDDDESPLSEQVSASPGGDYVLVQFGNGRVADVSERFAVDRRIHILLLAEGYLDTALSAFETDVGDWVDELFAVGIYQRYREAFVIWSLPLASEARVGPTDPQTADTAFLVPLNDDGRGVSRNVPADGPTAQRVWGLMDSFPYPPTLFYGEGGTTHNIAKNLVVAIMIFDANRGRSGLSGRSRRLENPSDPNQRISSAIAHNRPHEFSHAFVRLQDEYLDEDQSGLGQENLLTDRSSRVSNVVDEPSCDTLPWRHLLPGGSINPETEGLIGAFGTSDIGYHSEFKCMMNGTHDNDVFYGGDGRLRTADRLCNFCRELTAFRIFEHIGLLDDPEDSLATWASDYREPFYESAGFVVPTPVPQENSEGTAHFEACVP